MQYFFAYRRKLAVILIILVLLCIIDEVLITNVYGASEKPAFSLNAISACLMDADTNRVLYGKNENEVRAMASTTKIMTLIVILENANLDDIVTISQNAARQPDVQLNVNTGEEYVLRDLLYSMMLESHNDVAVALAEHVGGSVEGFAQMMNGKAKELGLSDTYFITPNGLDAQDERGKHSTTAVELAKIASYAIKNEKFVEIINTRSYSFAEVHGKRHFTVNNKDLFLDMMNGAIGIKTGFTGEAGYCFVGAVKQDDRCFVSVVLGSGWPPNKTYKWKDTQKLMKFGIENYFNQAIYDEEFVIEIPVAGGVKNSVCVGAKGYVQALLSEYDNVKVYYEHRKKLSAPVKANEIIGHILVTVNGMVIEKIDIKTYEEVKTKGYKEFLSELLELFSI